MNDDFTEFTSGSTTAASPSPATDLFSMDAPPAATLSPWGFNVPSATPPPASPQAPAPQHQFPQQAGAPPAQNPGIDLNAMYSQNSNGAQFNLNDKYSAFSNFNLGLGAAAPQAQAPPMQQPMQQPMQAPQQPGLFQTTSATVYPPQQQPMDPFFGIQATQPMYQANAEFPQMPHKPAGAFPPQPAFKNQHSFPPQGSNLLINKDTQKFSLAKMSSQSFNLGPAKSDEAQTSTALNSLVWK